ncbi:Threonine--tRNA ligase, mitochondrial [Wickerhamiella sorbophila]|uniref:threonine--tRNA ligase n=1 Tax=Wickerhamiella sorbophila TaxID=45607 RepID=A0A2T0FKU4_9ASCO|nr:Threonine--tRNA ligase, mitochondrial [Wickerhamiella sorbophila]PRT55599.1 Threonine--tRNA ligase, mitochondrial [Wickerhamiella sorbophila]
MFRVWQSVRHKSTTAVIKEINDVQKLYMNHPWSPGSTFFYPEGAHVFGKLVSFMKAQMTRYGFQEVVTPQLYRKELWQTSGHWDHYRDDMFGVCDGHDTDKIEYSLKPMNCPGHCLLFASRERSFRELPVRYSDFSSLHRNEASGALQGLTRVRRFHQDDGHIFCRPDQVAEEIERSIALVDTVYKVFGLEYTMLLSTRPEDFMGERALWDEAEDGLRKAIEASAKPVVINEGDGAFYGPKIDFVVKDNLGKSHQAATIQLDFQLPRNFGLTYDDKTGAGVPVIVHRAVLGSVERFMALLMDHYSGKWPFWLNPRQVVVIPVSDAHAEYADQVAERLRNFRTNDGAAPLSEQTYAVEVYKQSEPLSGRLKRATELSASFVVVVGDREVQDGTISVRERGVRKSVTMTVDDLKELFVELTANYAP